MSSADARRLLHKDAPLRVWSLIVTIFGDAVMDRGTILQPAPVWTSDLMALLDLLGIDAGLARTSLSRLVANHTLERGRQGRNTFYSLSPESAHEFVRAAAIIYGPDPRKPCGDFLLAALDLCAERKQARAALAARGFRFLSSTLALAPRHEPCGGSREGDRDELPADVIFSMAAPSEALAKAVRDAWQLDALDRAYQRFTQDFAALQAAPDDAILARIAAVHRFRRIVLRDPVLPTAVLPACWHGHEARRVFDRVMADVRAESDVWLAGNGFRHAAPGAALRHNK